MLRIQQMLSYLIVSLIDQLSYEAPSTSMHESRPGPDGPAVGLFSLPRELRDMILLPLLEQPTNVINAQNRTPPIAPEDVAAVPAICSVNRQLRRETLPTYYTTNRFTVLLYNQQDVLLATQWLAQIVGPAHVGRIRSLAVSGRARVLFGHMTIAHPMSIWLDLPTGTLSFKEGLRARQAAAEVTAMVEEMVARRKGKPWTSEALCELMSRFHLICLGY